MTPRLDRRSFLSGCAATSALAAIVDPRRARAQAQARPPQRLLIFAHLNGQITTQWRPTGDERNFALTDPTSPLAPWRSKLLFVDGLQMQTAIDSGIDPHASALSGALTGRSDIKGVNRGHPSNVQSGSLSIDQHVADKLRGPARLRSAELTVGLNCGGQPPCLNYPVGGGRSLPYLSQPDATFDRLFGGALGTSGAGDPNEARRATNRRASVLDHVARELGALGKRLPREDAQKVSFHLDGIRDLEKQITTPIAAACSGLPRPKAVANDKNLTPDATKLQLDLLIQAFACDVTRVATFANGDTSWNAPAPFLGCATPPHAISHGAPGYNWNEVGPRIMRWSYEQMAYLLRGLDAIREGDGTVLDHTLVLSMSEFGQGHAHSHKNVPYILVGSAGGYFKQGAWLKLPGLAHNDFLSTIAESMGVPTKTFGDPKYCTGPMAALRA